MLSLNNQTRRGARPLWSNPVTQAVVVLTGALLGAYMTMMVANLWPPNPEQQCAWQFPKLLSCLLGVRENLAGGVMGAAGAVFAAWIAYKAVLLQIAKSDVEKLERQQASRTAAVLALSQPIHSAATVLKLFRRAIAADSPLEMRVADRDVAYQLRHTQVALDHFTLREIASELNENDRAGYLVILLHMSTLVRIAADPVPDSDRRRRLEMNVEQFERMGSYIQAFDNELARVFARDGEIPVARLG